VKILTVSLSKLEFISNPYVKAKFVELVYYLIQRNKPLMRDIFKYNEIAKVYFINLFYNFKLNLI